MRKRKNEESIDEIDQIKKNMKTTRKPFIKKKQKKKNKS